MLTAFWPQRWSRQQRSNATLVSAVILMVLALALHMFVTYSLALKFVGNYSPAKLFKGSQEAMVMAFSTASSSSRS